MTNSIPERFGSMVFNDTIMREKLPKDTYKSLKRTISMGKHLDADLANIVANAMKDWAVEKGATHYTHWFQPMTGMTAEKHDGFITDVGDGKIIMDFSGKELVQGEPDASSFPNGGIRSTFEARGYTVWDTTSYAFIKGGTLYIPTAFCSYTGESLDIKTPLLRSMEALNTHAMRILKLFGNTSAKRVNVTVGAEQEYFLVDKEVFRRRADLLNCGRTLFGAAPSKGQEMDDHYFGCLKPRVAEFMKELDEELWDLGILSKTKHNEVAPAQHELAPIFNTTNIATDQNQLTMEMLKTVADRHGMACLLHEKPFAGLNGSGKHNNWSMSTDTGINLLEPGETPYDNAQFILFLCAVIKAVDEYQDLLRITVSSAGNDHRLGGHEAPPAIVSMFVGDELVEILKALEKDLAYNEKEKGTMHLGAVVLPHFSRDATDRNRTSPFAFTGNKFEFRMLGSSFSVGGPNIVLNTVVAEQLKQFADVLEQSANFENDLNALVRKTIIEHNRIVFNGNNYAAEWTVEAEKRGLLNLRNTAEALPYYIHEKNLKVFEAHKVFSRDEMHARYEISLERYSKTIRIEALTLADMVKKEILVFSADFQQELLTLITGKASLSIDCALEKGLLQQVSDVTATMYQTTSKLEQALDKAKDIEDMEACAKYYQATVLAIMDEVRVSVDTLESVVPDKFWTMPTYAEMLYSV